MNSVKNNEQIRLERRTRFYWRVTFDHPPLNIFGPETIPQLNKIGTALETDDDVKVVVFDSAVDGFFRRTTIFSPSSKTRHVCCPTRRDCRHFPTRWCGSAALRSSR